MAGEAEELEALFVRVYARTENFFAPMKAVREEVERVAASFAAINGGAGQAAQGFAKIEVAATGLVTAINQINTAAGAINIQGLVGNLTTLANSNLTTSLGQLAKGLADIGRAEIGQAGTKLRELAGALSESKLGLKSVANAASNLDALSKSLGNFLGLNTGAISQAATNIGDALATLNRVITEGKFSLGIKSVANAAGNVRALGNAFRSLVSLDTSGVTRIGDRLAGGITRITNALMPLSTKGKRQTLLASKAAADSISNLANLGATIGMFRIPRDRMQALTDFTNWLPTINAALSTGKKGLFGTVAAQASIKNLESLAKSLAGLGSANVTTIASNMQSLAGALQPLTALNIGALEPVLQGLGTALPLLGAGVQGLRGSGMFGTTAIRNLAANLNALGTDLSAMSNLNAAGIVASAQALGTALPLLGAGMRGLKGSGLFGAVGIGNLAKNLNALGTNLPAMSNLNAAGIVASAQALEQGLPAIGRALVGARGSGLFGAVGIGNLAKNLTALAQATTALSTANPTAIINNARAMRAWLRTLGGSVTADQLKVLKDLAKTLNAFTSFNAAFANLGNKLPIQQNVNYNLHATQRAGQAASLGLDGVTGSTNRMARSMIGANTSLTLTRLSLAAFAGFGVVHFARFDELMARTLARMGEFSAQARERLGRGVLDLSTHTMTDAGHMASALGVLSAAGMNQPMAMQVLPLVETHAAASGLEAARAARHLTSVLNALGMTTGDVTQDIANLTRISNVFVRTSQLVDTTVEELTDAFSGRFAAAIRQVGWTLEQGMSLIAMYADANIRGADAGNRASVVLQSLEHALVGNLQAWRALGLGVEEFNDVMHHGPSALIGELEKRLAGLNPVQQRGLLEAMGFESRVTQALYPLLGLAHAGQLVHDSLLGLEGVSERVANAIRNSFGGQIKILWNNLKAMAIDIGDTIAPAVGWLGQHIRVLVTWFRNLSAPMQKLLVWGLLIVTVIGPVIAVLLTLKAAFLGLFVAVGTGFLIVTSLTALLWGVKLAVLAVAIGWDNLWSAGIGTVRAMGQSVEWLGSKLKTALGFFWNFQENMEILSAWFNRDDAWKDVGEIVATINTNLFNNFGKFFDWLSHNWGNLWDDALLVLGRVLDRLFNAFMAVFKGVVAFAKGSFTMDLGDAITGAFVKALEAAATAAGAAREHPTRMAMGGMLRRELPGMLPVAERRPRGFGLMADQTVIDRQTLETRSTENLQRLITELQEIQRYAGQPGPLGPRGVGVPYVGESERQLNAQFAQRRAVEAAAGPAGIALPLFPNQAQVVLAKQESERVRRAILTAISLSGSTSPLAELSRIEQLASAVVEQRMIPQRVREGIADALRGNGLDRVPFRTEALPAFAPLLTLTPAKRRQAAIAHAQMTGMRLGSITGMGLGSIPGAFAGYMGLPAVMRLPQPNTSLDGPRRGDLPDSNALSAARLIGSVSPMMGLPMALNAIVTTMEASSKFNLMSAWLRMHGPGMSGAGEPPPFLPGGHRAGTTFATMSERRFVIGGPGTAMIEQSVKDHNLANKFDRANALLQNGFQNLPQRIAGAVAEAIRPPTRESVVRAAALTAGSAP